MQRTTLLTALVLGLGGCVFHADDEPYCGHDESYDCYVEYSPGYGYSRVCDVAVEPLVCIDVDDADYGPRRYPRPVSSDGASGGAGGTSSAGSAGSGGEGGSGSEEPSEPDGFDFPCARDAQCGTGLCREGECFYGCAADTDCGTADRCTPVDTVSVCKAGEEPVIECTRSAECAFEQVCLNAACHDSCTLTSDCSNELDRCVTGVCVPDRRVVSECLLDRECPSGEACIDATCQAR